MKLILERILIGYFGATVFLFLVGEESTADVLQKLVFTLLAMLAVAILGAILRLTLDFYGREDGEDSELQQVVPFLVIDWIDVHRLD